jgi:hypothetical protein
LYRKSTNTEARLAYLGHLLMENRHDLIVDAQATIADGFAEREAASAMLTFTPRSNGYEFTARTRFDRLFDGVFVPVSAMPDYIKALERRTLTGAL